MVSHISEGLYRFASYSSTSVTGCSFSMNRTKAESQSCNALTTRLILYILDWEKAAKRRRIP
jgi:hypothetical protein